jgi:hypothetical protein
MAIITLTALHTSEIRVLFHGDIPPARSSIATGVAIAVVAIMLKRVQNRSMTISEVI